MRNGGSIRFHSSDHCPSGAATSATAHALYPTTAAAAGAGVHPTHSPNWGCCPLTPPCCPRGGGPRLFSKTVPSPLPISLPSLKQRTDPRGWDRSDPRGCRHSWGGLTGPPSFHRGSHQVPLCPPRRVHSRSLLPLRHHLTRGYPPPPLP